MSISSASQATGIPKSSFYDVFRGRFDGFSAVNARKILAAWPDWGLEWEDLLFFRERYLKPPEPMEERDVASLMAAVDAVVEQALKHPDARKLVLQRIKAEVEAVDV